MAAASPTMRPAHPRPRALEQLVQDFAIHSVGGSEVEGVQVTGVTIASGDARPGDLFVALPGANAHGARFAEAAVKSGAVAVLTDVAGAELAAGCSAPVLIVDNVRAHLGDVAAWVYGTAELGIPTFGVTGTNGKTSVVYLLTALLGQLAVSSGLSTTAERRIGDEAIPSGLTTPEASELHGLLAVMKERSVGAVALEVSAQALSRHRVDGVHFDVVGYTNLSHDHFDDYASFEEYFEAKAQLFSPERAARGVVLVDDAWGRKLATKAKIPVTIVTMAGEGDADWQCAITQQSARSVSFVMTNRDGRSLRVSVPVVGAFMAANAAVAIAMLVDAGYNVEDIARVLERDGGIDVYIPGRGEIVSGDSGPTVYVDYGHTPDAFEGLLTTLREVTDGRVFMVFGADGDRDVTKRHDMGAIAARGADVVIITDFHPRTEEPAAIRAALLEGAHAAGTRAEILEEADPQVAMRLAIRMAGENDAILYAGPGHEDYREVNGVYLDYNAREDVKAALREAGLPPRGENA